LDSVLFCGKPANESSLFVERNARYPLVPLFVEINSGHSRGIGGICATISVVLGPPATPQIALAVVGPVLIDVVYELTGLGLHHNSMEPHETAATIEVIAAHEVSVFVFVPTAALNQREVFDIE
jgi:hypothetical protein